MWLIFDWSKLIDANSLIHVLLFRCFVVILKIYIVTKLLYCVNFRIQSVDGQDVSPLFESPFDFQQEMLFCFVQFVGIGNCYNKMCNDNLSFTHWNTMSNLINFWVHWYLVYWKCFAKLQRSMVLAMLRELNKINLQVI